MITLRPSESIAYNQRTSNKNAYFDLYSTTVQSNASERDTFAGLGTPSGIFTKSDGAPTPVSTGTEHPATVAALPPERADTAWEIRDSNGKRG